MTSIKGKRILLGVTGGIAAYKAVELARIMVKAGVDLRVAMTDAATHFITPVTMQAVSGQAVWTDLWDRRVPDNMAHIELSRDRELILVAPATADFMAKVAHGLADDLLATMVLARRCPLMLAPAMNVEMWDNPATQRNVLALRDDGILFAGPAAGDQACGETGMGRMLEAEQIAEEVEAVFQPCAPGPRCSWVRRPRRFVKASSRTTPMSPCKGLLSRSPWCRRSPPRADAPA